MYPILIVGNVRGIVVPVNKAFKLNLNTTEDEWTDLDPTDPAGSIPKPGHYGNLPNFSAESRADRRNRKLRMELVREHIENTKNSPSVLRALFDRVFKRS